jgi:glycosyltransferase involved in cell wall biosynthesis
VVVDDGSTDGTAAAVDAVADSRVRLERNRTNLGQAAAFNRAVALARAPLVKFLSADDLLLESCLERMAGVFDEAPVGLVFARRGILLHWDDERARSWVQRYRSVHDSLGPLQRANPGGVLFGRWLAAGFRDNLVGEPSSVMMRRDVFLQLGGFNPYIEGAIDMELWVRAFVAADVGFVDEELSLYRVHEGSLTARVHGRPRVTLDRAWLLHALAVEPGAVERYPELRRLRRSAEVRVLKDWLRSPGRLPRSTGRYVLSRMRAVPRDRPLEPLA